MENNSSVWILTGGFEVQGLHYQRVGPLRKTETRRQTQQHIKETPGTTVESTLGGNGTFLEQ